MIEITGPVFVTIIEHRHGSNFYVNRTEEGALLALYAYVVGEWENEDIAAQRDRTNDGQPFGPIEQYDHSTAIEIYFEQVATEYWIMDQASVGD